MTDPRMRPGFIIAASVIVLLLFASLSALTSFQLPFIRPSGSSEVMLLFVLSTLIFLSLVIFGFILFRSLFKLTMERRANLLGSKFKTKLVFGALTLSVAPVCFLFLFSYSLLNRTLDKWFSRPYEAISRDAQDLVEEIREFARNRAATDAEILALEVRTSARTFEAAEFNRILPQDSAPRELDYFAVVDPEGVELLGRGAGPGIWEAVQLARANAEDAASKRNDSIILSRQGISYAVGWSELDLRGHPGLVLTARELPAKIAESAARLNEESVLYGELSQERRSVRSIYLSILLLLTVLILFIATWFALYFSRQVTVPIQALAEATNEVSRGNLEYRVRTRAADELGVLVSSFNEMTEQLAAGRAAREQARVHLELMNSEIDQRRQFTEAILESIPSGVITVSADGTILESIPSGVMTVSADGAILESNGAARRLFGETSQSSQDLGHVSRFFAGENWRDFRYLIKRASRTGQVARHMEIHQGDRTLHLAVTVSSLSGERLDPSGKKPDTQSFVLVMEDLSDLIRAQKAAAWGEVAQRVAHEIKNPLTPIALSADRIHLWLDREKRTNSPEFNRAVQESCSLIQQEVGHLQRLVNEFAQFARLPEARPSSANLNQVIESALNLFNGRLDGIHIHKRLADDLPSVQVDAEQFRRVFVNLIDNAAEAMEQSLVRELVLTTRPDPARDLVEVEVADTGCGVTPEDKEKLFLPYFSTKNRGTGLGLAIVNRIISEHKGTIRTEKNEPIGTRFIIELPTPPAA